jgi:hypothetical protein
VNVQQVVKINVAVVRKSRNFAQKSAHVIPQPARTNISMIVSLHVPRENRMSVAFLQPGPPRNPNENPGSPQKIKTW